MKWESLEQSQDLNTPFEHAHKRKKLEKEIIKIYF